MRNRESRLQALEQRQVATGDFPGYVWAANEEEAITKLAALGNMVRGAVKLYLGADFDFRGPDEWDRDNETNDQTAEA